jgi:hypothetical protein
MSAAVMIEPRGLTREQTMQYVGCTTLSAFKDWLRRGILPGPMPGTHRWDRKAIDAKLDQLSNIEQKSTEQTSQLNQWLEKRASKTQRISSK